MASPKTLALQKEKDALDIRAERTGRYLIEGMTAVLSHKKVKGKRAVKLLKRLRRNPDTTAHVVRCNHCGTVKHTSDQCGFKK